MPVAFAAASLACRTMTYVLTDGRDSCLLESAQGLLNKLRQPGPRVNSGSVQFAHRKLAY
jgi:hypothetical protein